jgi:glycerol transport system ATP-binding protein
VGHFIGSPGMNVLPATLEGGAARFHGRPVELAEQPPAQGPGARLEIGVRPEFVSLAPEGLPVRITKVSDTGRHRIVEASHDGTTIRLLVREGDAVPAERAFLRFDRAHTRLYADGWLVT